MDSLYVYADNERAHINTTYDFVPYPIQNQWEESERLKDYLYVGGNDYKSPLYVSTCVGTVESERRRDN